MDFQSLVTAVGTFDPDNMDPVELLSKLEKVTFSCRKFVTKEQTNGQGDKLYLDLLELIWLIWER